MKSHTIILALCLLATQAKAEEAVGIWSNFQGNAAHTAFVDVKADPAKFKVLWQRDIWHKSDNNDLDNLVYPIATTNHLIYFAISDAQNREHVNSIYALNPATGAIVWQANLSQSAFIIGPVYSHGKLYVINVQGSLKDNKSYVQALDAETGSTLYSTFIPLHWDNAYAYMREPIIENNHLYIANDGREYDVDATSGRVIWSAAAGTNRNFQVVSGAYITRATDGGIDYVKRESGGDKSSMTLLDNKRINFALHDPVWDEKNKIIYQVFVNDNFDPPCPDHCEGWIPTSLFAIDMEHKTAKWKVDMPAIWPPALTNDNKLYFMSDEKLYEVDALKGSINWTTPIPGITGFVLATPDIVFIGTGRTIAVSRKTHQVVWESNIIGRLSIDNNRLYIISTDHDVVHVAAVALN